MYADGGDMKGKGMLRRSNNFVRVSRLLASAEESQRSVVDSGGVVVEEARRGVVERGV